MLGLLRACGKPDATEGVGTASPICACFVGQEAFKKAQQDFPPDTIVMNEGKFEDCYPTAPPDTMVLKEKQPAPADTMVLKQKQPAPALPLPPDTMVLKEKPVLADVNIYHEGSKIGTQQDVKSVPQTSEKEKENKKSEKENEKSEKEKENKKSEKEKENQRSELKELLTAFVASAKEGLHCTALRVIDDVSVYKSSVVLTLDEQLQSLCLASSKGPSPRAHSNSWLHGLDSWKALLSECQIYGYYKLEELRPESASLKFVAPEDRELCTMIFHNKEWMYILAKDAAEQYAIMKALQVIAVRATQISGRRAMMGGA